MNKNILIAEKIAHEVKKAGGECYFVGGCVRDKILGNSFDDIDIEVHGIMADTLESILSNIGHKREMGKSFGIWGLDGYSIDIAMPRTEEATGRGHRDFKTYTDPFLGTERAAARRDFTMNAIMENVLTGELVDHFGGISDIKNKIIRHVNDKSFGEDPLRVLRAAGFAARFNFIVCDETRLLCEKMELTTLSRERVFAELTKVLTKSEKPSLFFDILRRCGQLTEWFSEIESLISVTQNPEYHSEGDVYNHTMLVLDISAGLREQAEEPLYFMLSALCHDFGKAVTTKVIDGKIRAFDHENRGIDIADTFLSRLSNEHKLKKYVLNMIKLHMRPNMLVGQNAGKKAYNRLFDEAYSPSDLLLLAKADHLGSLSNMCSLPYEQTEAKLKNALDKYREIMNRPYVSGSDLVAAGLNPGKNFSKLLEYAHKLRISGVDKKEALAQTLAYAKEIH